MRVTIRSIITWSHHFKDFSSSPKLIFTNSNYSLDWDFSSRLWMVDRCLRKWCFHLKTFEQTPHGKLPTPRLVAKCVLDWDLSRLCTVDSRDGRFHDFLQEIMKSWNLDSYLKSMKSWNLWNLHFLDNTKHFLTNNSGHFNYVHQFYWFSERWQNVIFQNFI